MGHAEVAETPREAGQHVRRAGHQLVVIFAHVHGGRHKVGRVHREHREDGREHQGGEHQQALEEVGPAHGVEAAEEHVDEDQRGGDHHGRLLVPAEHGVEQRAAGVDAGGGVDAVGDHEHDRGDDLQRLVIRQEAVREKLRNRDRVVRADGVAAQTGRHVDPRQDRADGQTDADPDLADAEQIDRARQAHQHPRAHIGRAGTQRRDPAVHLTAAEEVFLLARVLAVAEEEIDADGDDHCEVQQHGNQFSSFHFGIPPDWFALEKLI